MPVKLPEPESTLTLRELNRAALARQMLLKRETVGVVEAVERLAGLQAQYSPSPYIGLWTRIEGFKIEDLVAAVLDRSVVKASLMRWTLHLASSRDYPYFTVAVSDALIATSRKEAEEAGVDIATLHKALIEYTAEQRLLSEIVDFATDIARASTVRSKYMAWRWAHSPGWLVHVPPSGTWRYFGSNSYMSAHEWLGRMQEPTVEEAITYLVRRYLAAFGPSTVADIVQWAGLRSVGRANAALADLAAELVAFKNEEGKILYDLRDAPRPGADVPAPIRYLPKWDNLLLAYQNRTRVLPEQYRKIIIKVNGDVTPTFLVDGVVAGMWGTAMEKGIAVLKLEALEPLSAETITELEEEGERLVRFMEPEAKDYEIRLSDYKI